MNETERYILEVIRRAVWSGFYSAERVQAIIDDVLEEGADEDMLRAAVAPEFEKKAAAEVSWPDTTDCDRLDKAFKAAAATGFAAIQNAGYTMSDGLTDVRELGQRSKKKLSFYCFYHGQDVEGAVDGGSLFIAFGSLSNDDNAKQKAGRRLVGILRDVGLEVDWDGDAEQRIRLPSFDWKRRSKT